MDIAQLDRFLASLDDAPEYLREVIYREHAGQAPCWRAVSIQRVHAAIVEVAEDLRTHRASQRYAVVYWYWRAQYYGKQWTTFDTLEAASKHRDRMFRIDSPPDSVRA